MADDSNPSNPRSDSVNPVPKQEDAKDPHNEPAFGVGTSVRLPNTNVENHRTTETEERRQQRWKTRREWVATGFSVVALILSYFSYNTAQTALIMGQRAWVVLDKVSVPEGKIQDHTFYIPPDGKTELLGEYVNVGKSPALNTVVIALSKVQETKEPPPCNKIRPNGKTESRATVANDNRSQPLRSPIGITDLTPDNIKALEENRKKFYVYGLIEYEDVFHAKRKSTFCQILVQGSAIVNFQNCPCGNDAE